MVQIKSQIITVIKPAITVLVVAVPTSLAPPFLTFIPIVADIITIRTVNKHAFIKQIIISLI